MTSKLQCVGYHGNRLDFVKLKGLSKYSFWTRWLYNLSLDYKTWGTLMKTKAMTKKCRNNIHLQEQAPRNEYQYNAATKINRYIVLKASQRSKNCVNQKIRTHFLKAQPWNQVGIWHYIISMHSMLINKQLIFVESNVTGLSKRFMCFGTPDTCNAIGQCTLDEIKKKSVQNRTDFTFVQNLKSVQT